ncbi:MAG: hypothetical protein ACYTEL_14610 [Planctomycetota bacterium]|jgi:hypothetical protein
MKNIILIVSLIISVVGNLTLLAMFFFKSALNEILKEWWLEKRKQKRESKNRLVELRKRLITMQRLTPSMLINQANLKYITDPSVKDRDTVRQSKMIEEWGQANRYVLENEVYYPKDIRALYREYSEKLGKALAEIITDEMYKEGLLEIANIITIMDSLLIELEDYLSKS